jgi:guanosine-3',5'-bis(diphosphate) 3'-pyrophosphohydrolase
LQNEKSNHKVDIFEIKKAIYYAKKYHGNQKRASGEPYYSHPLAVAELVAPHCFKTDILVTSILHDTIEDTTLTKELLEYIFDANIASKVEDLTRLKFDTKISSAEIIKILLLKHSYDVLFIKYCDRLHNMQSIHVKPAKKISKIVEENLKYLTSVSIYFKSMLPGLLKSETLHNSCYQKQPLNKKCLSSYLEDNFQLPPLTFQNEKDQS